MSRFTVVPGWFVLDMHDGEAVDCVVRTREEAEEEADVLEHQFLSSIGGDSVCPTCGAVLPFADPCLHCGETDVAAEGDALYEQAQPYTVVALSLRGSDAVCDAHYDSWTLWDVGNDEIDGLERAEDRFSEHGFVFDLNAAGKVVLLVDARLDAATDAPTAEMCRSALAFGYALGRVELVSGFRAWAIVRRASRPTTPLPEAYVGGFYRNEAARTVAMLNATRCAHAHA